MAEPMILNSQSKTLIRNTASLSTEDVVNKLRVSITSLKAAHMSEDGSKVDYQSMAASPQFQDYLEAAHLLVNYDPSSFAEEKKKAFFLNIYNSLTLHGMVHQAVIKGSLTAPKEVPGFWSITCYNIGGLVYSLDDIEHGVLRANKGHPAANKAQFSKDDPRTKVTLQHLDPRIHFALNCGAKSCPPIRVYKEERLDSQLNTASRSFLQQEVNVVEGDKEATVETSRLLLWYGRDFGSNDRAIIEWLAAALEDDQLGNQLRDALTKGDVKLVFRDYDWGANVGED